MQSILINSSIVLVTQDHVPPVNHDFLVNKKIIPENFQKKNNSISTPVVSQIYYNNGFTIVTEPKRTLIQVQVPSVDESKNLKNLSLLRNISSEYIKSFEYINYQAIGINFDFIREGLKYSSFIEKIIKQDAQLSFENNKGEIRNLELSYNLKGKQFNVKAIKVEGKTQSANHQDTIYGFVPFFKINVNYPSNYTDNKTTIVKELEENYNQSKKFIGGF